MALPMKSNFLFALVVFACIPTECAYTPIKAIRLDDSNFESRSSLCQSSSSCNWFIIFYAPWCDYCKELLPVWDRLAEELEGELMVGRLDIEANPQTKYRLRHRVKGYPTMLYVQTQNGRDKLYAYSGTRDINHLKNFARRDWENVEDGAKSSMPPPTESLPPWQRYILEPAHDYIAAIMTSFEGIWGQYRDELLCVISVSFFCGCYVGFILKAAIDALLPVPPPRTASAASAAPAAAAAAAANPRASPAPRRPKAQ